VNVRTLPNPNVDVCGALAAVALLLAGCAHSPAPSKQAAPGTAAPVAQAAALQKPNARAETRREKRSRRARGGDEAANAQAGVSAVPEAVAQRHAEAIAAIDAERYDEAEAALEEVVAAAPELIGPRINLAILYLRAARLEEAQAALEQALALEPGSAAAETQLGIVLRKRGRFAEAEQAYLAALAADPGYANAHYNIGVLYDLYLQRPTEALAHYEQFQALSGAPDEQVAKWIADLSRRNGEPKAAEAAQE
jgi:Tfp pilus assembly protein PilF